MARYGRAFKDKVLRRLLPPQSADVPALAKEVGVSPPTLERWQAELLSGRLGHRCWSATARLEAVLATMGMSEEQKNAWCRDRGVCPRDVAAWRKAATAALETDRPDRPRAQQARADRRRIRQLERGLRRKDKALVETAALLVLTKKFAAIVHEETADA